MKGPPLNGGDPDPAWLPPMKGPPIMVEFPTPLNQAGRKLSLELDISSGPVWRRWGLHPAPCRGGPWVAGQVLVAPAPSMLPGPGEVLTHMCALTMVNTEGAGAASTDVRLQSVFG